MIRLPFNRFARCAFYTPIQVADVQLLEDEILGQWGSHSEDFYGEKGILLAQRFANWPSEPKKILQFTKRYGPLNRAPSDGSLGYSFSLYEWRLSQRHMQSAWRTQMDKAEDWLCANEHILLESRPNQIVLQCRYLQIFMNLEISTNADKLRICKREGCDHPYFVPLHGKEIYCSIDCSGWAQSRWKKRWHEQQREKRIKEEKVNGTHKTR